jgi:DNA-binding response OmpR family regulator
VIKETESAQEPRALVLTGTILFVEDDDTLRAGVVSALGALGYDVLAAPDGEVALDLFRTHRSEIDVIVSDVLMPKLDGRGLYDAVREESTTVRFVFSTGQGARAAEVLGALGSDVPLLAKPWTLGELMRAIGRALSPVAAR